jgi:hypothetical protein
VVTDGTLPIFSIYVVWHPDFDEGLGLAEALRNHFRRMPFEAATGGAGIDVLYRFAPPKSTSKPIAIDFAESQTTAVIVLLDENLATDPDWIGYVQELARETRQVGLKARLFPIEIDSVLRALNIPEQAHRYAQWPGGKAERLARMKLELSYEFCRMMRHYLAHLTHPHSGENELKSYLEKVQIFLSHSKHDAVGEQIARQIRDKLHSGHGLASFFDAHDIPGGLQFDVVLLHNVRTSAVVAIHTDSYSSREWCRRELLEAKRHNVPLVIANAITDIDERGFPYMGNVPIVRLDVDGPDRIDVVVARLLDEVLKDYLWKCRVAQQPSGTSEITFLPRPPELVCLAEILKNPAIGSTPLVIYPDPPLSAEEERLFSDVAPSVQLRSFTEWISGSVR